MDKGNAAFFWCVFAVMLCVNLPFIVCDLVFAARDNACVTTVGTGVAFDLGVWLQVDGYCRLAVTCLFLLTSISACINIDTGLKLFACTMCCVIIYSFFNLAWLIVGSVLFWGDLNQRNGICNGTEVQGYMYAVLILGFIGACSSMVSSYKQRDWLKA